MPSETKPMPERGAAGKIRALRVSAGPGSAIRKRDRYMFIRGLCMAFAAMVWAGTASAVVIGFDEFNDHTQPAYSGHSEQGFDVMATKGNWREAYYFGTPFPSIFSRSDKGKLVIRAEDFSTFSAASLSIGNGGLFSGNVRYTVRGVLGGVQAFKVKGNVTTLAGFENVLLDDSQDIDKLIISIDGRNAVSFNVDNIDVTPASVVAAVVPVPASVLLLFAGLLGLTGLSRLKAQRQSVKVPQNRG
jgi:hypothetical protein